MGRAQRKERGEASQREGEAWVGPSERRGVRPSEKGSRESGPVKREVLDAEKGEAWVRPNKRRGVRLPSEKGSRESGPAKGGSDAEKGEA